MGERASTGWRYSTDDVLFEDMHCARSLSTRTEDRRSGEGCAGCIGATYHGNAAFITPTSSRLLLSDLSVLGLGPPQKWHFRCQACR